MAQLDYPAVLARLPPGMWQHLLGWSHDLSLMPYEQAEIQEYTQETEDDASDAPSFRVIQHRKP